MELDQELVRILAESENTSYECLQIAPMGANKCAILFLLADPDYESKLSLVFVVDDFEAKSAKGVFIIDEWLMSISATASGELFALEATTWMWRYKGRNWTRQDISQIDLRRVWAKSPTGPIALGSQGHSLRLSGRQWETLHAPAAIQFFDVHANANGEIFACGSEGSLLKLEGTNWRTVELHTHDQFRGIDVSRDGAIRLAGDDGVCLKLQNGEITRLKAPATTFFAVRNFDGNFYWGDELGVYIERGQALEQFEETEIGGDLRSDGQFLYCAGTDTAWRFDGQTWKTLTLVYDKGFRLEN